MYSVLKASNLFSSCNRYYIDGPAEYGDFMYHLSKLMSEHAVFAASTGESPSIRSPSPAHSTMRDRFDFFYSLPDYGFTSVIDYEEVRRSFFFLKFCLTALQIKQNDQRSPPIQSKFSDISVCRFINSVIT